MDRTRYVVVAAAAAAALVLSACGSDQSDSTKGAAVPSAAVEPKASVVSGAAATKTAVAELRAGLTYLLTDHTYRTSEAIRQVVAKKGNMENLFVRAAVQAMDNNAVELSKAVGAIYPQSETQFLASWRKHNSLILDYAISRSMGNQTLADQARVELDRYPAAFGELMRSVAPGLQAAPIIADIQQHVTSMLAVADAAVANDDTEFAKMAAAAGQVPATVQTLVGEIAPNKKLAGNLDSAGVQLRSDMTYLFTSHVDLTGSALMEIVAVAGDRNEPGVRAAMTAVDQNSVKLAKLLAAGDAPSEQRVLESWRQHVGFLADYAVGQTLNDTAMMDQARRDLDGFSSLFGNMINSMVPQLPAQGVSGDMGKYVLTLFNTVDSQDAWDGMVNDKLGDASGGMPTMASTMAGGMAENKGLI